MKLSVIIPVFNEIRTLHEILHRVSRAPLQEHERENKITDLEIICVDDRSTDGSREYLENLRANFNHEFSSTTVPCGLKVIRQSSNQGKGAAVRTGIEASTGDIVLIQDADLEYTPTDYPKLLDPILANEADAVFGSRFLGNRVRVLYFWHAVINKILTLSLNILCNATFTDIETCYKVIRGNLARSLRLKSNRFGIEPELCARLAKSKARIFEVGISYSGRTYAEGKKIGPLDGLAALWHIIRFSLLSRNPLKPGIRQTLTALENASDRIYIEPLRRFLENLNITHHQLKALEIGSGFGAITQELLKFKTLVASDIEPEFVARLRGKFGFIRTFSAVQWDATLPVQNSKTPPEIRDGKFDMIVAFNVLEHIDDQDAAIANWMSLLNENGTMVLLVPFGQILFSPIDRSVGHFRRYTKTTLRHLIEANDATAIKTTFVNPLGVIGWIWNGLILKRTSLPTGQIKIYHLLKPVLWPLEALLQRFFGLSILCAVRPNRTATYGHVEHKKAA